MNGHSFDGPWGRPPGAMSNGMRSLLAAAIVLALLVSPLLVAPAVAAPTADPGGPYTGVIDRKLAFDGTGSTPDDDDIKHWYWNFGDGSDIKREKKGTTSHTYKEAGVYTVSLQVEDDEKVFSLWATTTVTIVDPNQPPAVRITDPVDGEVVRGTVTIVAVTADSVTYVDFLIDGVFLRRDWFGFNGWSTTWDTTRVVDGSHTISVRATNQNGTGPANSIKVTVANEPATTTTSTSTTTTSTTTTSTTLPTTTTSTTSTTTTLPTTTTSTSTPTTTTSTSTPTTTTTAAATTTTSGTSTTVTIDVTSTTLEVLGERIDVTSEARSVSAISFSITPLTLTPGDEITLTFELDAVVPGLTTVAFLLDGDPLGKPATVATGIESTFTRQLPSDLSVGSHRIELVTDPEPRQVLASRTVGVAAADAARIASPPIAPAATAQSTSLLPAIGLLALAAAAAVTWHNRRRWIPRRTRT